MANLEKLYRAIPEPTTDVAALLKTVQALKETVEILTGQRNGKQQGIGEQLTDIKSMTARSFARFTEYVEVSATFNSALVKRTSTLEAEVGEAKGKITNLEEVVITDDSSLVRKVSTLEGSVGNVTGRLFDIEEIVINGDDALVRRVTEIEARDPDGFAKGKLEFLVRNGPDGYVASYDLVLTANKALAGFTVLAKDVGGVLTSSISFTASQFMLFDPNLGATAVFRYADGVFVFNVPVKLLGQQIEPKGTYNSWYKAEQAVNNPDGAQVSTTIREGASVDVFCDFDGQPEIPVALTALLVLRIERETAGVITVLTDRRIPYYIAGNNENRARYSVYRAITYEDNPPAGDHIYRVKNVFQGHGPVSIRVIEKFR